MSISVPTTADHDALVARVAALEAAPPGSFDAAPLIARIAALEARPTGTRQRFIEGGPEVDATIPVYPYPGTQWRWIYRVSIGPLAAGDLVEAHATCEIRNDAGFNTELCTQFIVAPGGLYYHNDMGDCPEANPPWYAGGYLVAPISGENRNPEQHYWQLDRSMSWRCPVDMPSAYLHFRGRCRSTAANGSQICTIMQGYGEMNAVVTTGAI